MRDIASQYRTTRSGALAVRLTDLGWLRFDGADRLSFLQALLTNDVEAIEAHGGAYGLYLTPQGRVIADLVLLHRGDHVLAGVPAAIAGELAAAFDRVIFAEDVQVADVTASLVTTSIVGARAAEIVSSAVGVDRDAIARLEPWSQVEAGGSFSGVVAVRADPDAHDRFQIVAPVSLEQSVQDGLRRAGAELGSPQLLEALRIDAARPKFGVDMTTETIPLEAGLLERAISQTKGCYVGQEVIIRVLHRGGGRVAKRLVQITATEESAIAPVPGAKLLIGGADAGSVTSSAWSPEAGRARALAYVRREHAEAGTAVVAQWSDEAGCNHALEATITRLAG